MSAFPKLRASLLVSSLLLPLHPAWAQDAGTPDSAAESSTDIVVTATRQSERLSRVPISIAALGKEQMDKQGVRTIDDIVRLTPGLIVNRGGNNSNTVAIRGIASTAGASTTGIYIDDIPVQARNLGYAYSSAFPIVFDLERVEVLRGPQGTLFGAGSEGGTVRFIQPQPSLTDLSVYARGEVFTVDGGDPGYEIGVAVGAPIVADKIGFRISAYQRRDGGWIDAHYGTFNVVGSAATLGPKAATFTSTGIADENANWREATSLRGALTFAPTETLKITPSIFYQREYTNSAGNRFYSALSDPSKGIFGIPRFTAGAPDATHTALDGAMNDPSEAKFYLASNTIDWAGPGFNVISVTSWFKRTTDQTLDHTLLYTRFLNRVAPLPGDKGLTTLDDRQRNFTQEVRIQSSDPSARFTWLFGGFYSRQHQRSIQAEKQNFFVFGDDVFGAVNDGPPFGPGYSAFINAFGVMPLADGTSYYGDFETRESQLAGFGEIGFKVNEKLKLTAGLRVSRNKLEYTARYNGPEQNLTAPYGIDCPTGAGTCVPGQGIFTPDFGGGSASGSDTSVTPKFTISYQATENNLFYGTISKGFRPSGAQARLTTGCNPDLISNGFVDGNGNAVSPTTYGSDSVWNYEAGTKSSLFGGAVTVDASGYWIKWKNIQNNISLPVCASAITANLGEATSRGFDLALVVRPITGLTLGTSIGYNKTTYDQTIANPNTGAITFAKGTPVSGSGAPWTVVVNGQYDFTLDNRDFYLRSDFTFTSTYLPSGNTDPASANYDRLIVRRQDTSLLNARLGVKLGSVDVSAFMNNVLNSRSNFGLTHSGRTSPIFTGETFQPRTVGLTAIYRY